MTPRVYLILAAALFCTGVYGLLTRRDAIGLLLGVELMANAAGVALVTMAFVHGSRSGQVMALFLIALTVLEVGAGLALLLLLSRVKKDVSVDAIRELRG